MIRKTILYSFVLSVSFYVQSQNDSVQFKSKKWWYNKVLVMGYQNGYIFPTNQFLRGSNGQADQLDEYQSLFLKFQKQTTGQSDWEQLYNYPQWGVGLSVNDYYSPAEIGYPVSLYGTFTAPFVRAERSSFNYELSFGASTNWKCFDPLSNKYNLSIGANHAFFIDAGLNYTFEIAKQTELVVGMNLTHFSNGALKVPNLGINSVTPKIAVNYRLNEKPRFLRHEIKKFVARNEWEYSCFVGLKNLVFVDSVRQDIREKYEGLFFPTFGFTLCYNRQISHKSKFGLGINLAYNSTVNAEAVAEKATSLNDFDPVSGPITDKLQLSIFPSYELVAGKMSLTLQPAFYLYRKQVKKQSPCFHQRIGLKYSLTDHLFTGITLRDYSFHVSDFVEWSVGVRL